MRSDDLSSAELANLQDCVSLHFSVSVLGFTEGRTRFPASIRFPDHAPISHPDYATCASISFACICDSLRESWISFASRAVYLWRSNAGQMTLRSFYHEHTLLPVRPCHKSSWPTSRRVPPARTYCRRWQTKARNRLLLSEVDHL